MREPVMLFAVGLVAATGLLAIALIAAGYRVTAPWWILAALAAVAYIAERGSVYVDDHTQASISGLPILFAAVAYGPVEAMLVGALALLADFGRPLKRWFIWTGSRSLAAGFAGLTAAQVSGDTLASTVLAVGAAVLVVAALDLLFVSVTVTLRGVSSPRRVAQAMGRLLIVTGPLQVTAVALLSHAYREISPWTAVLFFFPALGCQRLLGLYREQRDLTDELLKANVDLEQANLSFASALVATLDARDHYTAGHSAAVAVYARDIATAMGLDVEDQELAHLAGLLHDIGKVGLPPGILEKAGPLTPLERRQMETHSAIGETILRNVPSYADVATIVRHHHERIDGRGYPDGLCDDHIPVLAKIVAVADAYSAMTSGRPYRAALDTEEARARILDASGSQFDVIVVRAFDSLLTSYSPTYQLGKHADFALEAQWARVATPLPAVA